MTKRKPIQSVFIDDSQYEILLAYLISLDKEFKEFSKKLKLNLVNDKTRNDFDRKLSKIQIRLKNLEIRGKKNKQC